MARTDKKRILSEHLFSSSRTAARRVLEKMRQKSELSQWRRGYINALEGMVAASEAKRNQNLFINQIRAEKSYELRIVFLQRTRNDLLDDFDKGYFSAWADYIQALKTTAKLK